jgi:ABC-type uncharacterized transport system involved in gliding motility auxiliary subunit
MAKDFDPRNQISTQTDSTLTALWAGALLLGLGAAFAAAGMPERPWVGYLLSGLFAADVIALIIKYRASLRGRSAAYGTHSAVTTLLVIAVVGLVNFAGYRYPKTFDLTKNRQHSLADQSKKVIRELKTAPKGVFYGMPGDREGSRKLLEGYRAANPEFTLDYVDPSKEPTRARQAGIRKLPTLALTVGERTEKLDELTEEKITNALIKLSKDKPQTICFTTGHGELAMAASEAEGGATLKKLLENQSYAVRDLNLSQETAIPADCELVAIAGPVRGFTPAEVKLVGDFLAQGGRALVMLNADFNQGVYSSDLDAALTPWFLKPEAALAFDLQSRQFGQDAGVPVALNISRDHPITKGMYADRPNEAVTVAFPIARPITILPNAPVGLNVQWLAKSSPQSWGERDVAGIKAGRAQPEASDVQGPLNLAVAVEGKLKDSKATKNTRLVVLGSTLMAANQALPMSYNVDFVLNAFSWLFEDENLISIRAKDPEAGKVDLSAAAGRVIFLLTVIALPLLISVGGIVIWVRRRRL